MEFPSQEALKLEENLLIAAKNKIEILKQICAELNASSSNRKKSLIFSFVKLDNDLKKLSSWIKDYFNMPMIQLRENTNEKDVFFFSVENKSLVLFLPNLLLRTPPFFFCYSVFQRSGAQSLPTLQDGWKKEIADLQTVQFGLDPIKRYSFKETLSHENFFDQFESTIYEWKLFDRLSFDSLQKKVSDNLPPLLNIAGDAHFIFQIGVNDNGCLIGNRFEEFRQNDLENFDRTWNDFLKGTIFPPLPEKCCKITWNRVELPQIQNPIYVQVQTQTDIDLVLRKTEGKMIAWTNEKDDYILEVPSTLFSELQLIFSNKINPIEDPDLLEFWSENRYLIEFEFAIPKEYPKIFCRFNQVLAAKKIEDRLIEFGPFDIWLWLKAESARTRDALNNSFYYKIAITQNNSKLKSQFPGCVFNLTVAPGETFEYTPITNLNTTPWILVLDILDIELNHVANISQVLYPYNKTGFILIWISKGSVSTKAFRFIEALLPFQFNLEFITYQHRETKPSINLSSFGDLLGEGEYLTGINLSDFANNYFKGNLNRHFDWSTLFKNGLTIERNQAIQIIQYIELLLRNKSGIQEIKITKSFPGCGASTILNSVGYHFRHKCTVLRPSQTVRTSLPQSEKPYLILADEIEISNLSSETLTIVLKVISKDIINSRNEFILSPFLDLQNEFQNMIKLYKTHFPQSEIALEDLRRVGSSSQNIHDRHIFCVILTAIRSKYLPVSRFVKDSIKSLNPDQLDTLKILAFLAIFAHNDSSKLKLKEPLPCELVVCRNGYSHFWHTWLAYHVLKDQFSNQTFRRFEDQTTSIALFDNVIRGLRSLDASTKLAYANSIVTERRSGSKFSKFITAFDHFQDIFSVIEKIRSIVLNIFLPIDNEKEIFDAHFVLPRSRLRRKRNHFQKALKDAKEAFQKAQKLNSHKTFLFKKNIAQCTLDKGEAEKLFEELYNLDQSNVRTIKQALKTGINHAKWTGRASPQQLVQHNTLPSNFYSLTFGLTDIDRWSEIS